MGVKLRQEWLHQAPYIVPRKQEAPKYPALIRNQSPCCCWCRYRKAGGGMGLGLVVALMVMMVMVVTMQW